MPPWYTYINRNTIDHNRKHGAVNPPVRFQRGKAGQATYANEVRIDGPVTVKYSPHEPLLKCGARLIIISEQKPEVIS